MKKIYTLNSCNTCIKILAQLPLDQCKVVNIKVQNIDAKTLDFVKEKMGSYEAIFSKKAMKFRSMGLDLEVLSEDRLRELMLQEYTFLKRPFIINGEHVFVGNKKQTVADAIESFEK